MPRDLFGNVTRPSVSIGNRKWYTVPLSLFTHALALAIVIALPLLAPAAMPSVFADDTPAWITAVLPTPPPPPPRDAVRPNQPQQFDAAPISAPSGITREAPRPDAGWEDASSLRGVIIGDANPGVILAPPPAPAPPQKPLAVGGHIRRPQKINDVQPLYPPMAQQARVEGIVIIEATLGVDGSVTNARVLRSIPLLDAAALDAVRQWAFTPTLLNGVPVPVVMTVTVSFVLGR